MQDILRQLKGKVFSRPFLKTKFYEEVKNMPWQDIILKSQVSDCWDQLDEVNAFLVTEVYPASVAAEAGIKAGWFFAPQNEVHIKNVKDLRFAQGEQFYTFYDRENLKKIVLTIKGYPFGMALRRSVLGLCVALESHDKPDFEAAAAVIHEGDDQEFLKIAVAASQSDRLVDHNEGDGIGGLMVLLKAAPFSDVQIIASNDNQGEVVASDAGKVMAEHFFMAAYLAFKGRSEQAEQFLPASHDYGAIYGFGGGLASLYYLAQGYIAAERHTEGSRAGKMEGIAADASDSFDAVFMFQRAFELNPKSVRAADMLEDLTGQKPQYQAYQPEHFYEAYDFPAHDPQDLKLTTVKPPVSYEAARKDLKEGEFLLVILLGLYRANGFYSQVMTLLTQLYPLIGGHFPAIHVITAYDESSPLKLHWLEGETFALECGLPIEILFDEDNEICTELEVNASPHGMIIDSTGSIIHRSALDEEQGFWQAVALGLPPEQKKTADILSFPFGKA